MVAGADNKFPYGNLPRLILAWICTEAVKTRSRELILAPRSAINEDMTLLKLQSARFHQA